MQQSKLGSLVEALINTVIGFVLTIAISPIVYPLFGHAFTFTQNLGITAIFTIVSILRSYAVRRWFNAKIKSFSSKF